VAWLLMAAAAVRRSGRWNGQAFFLVDVILEDDVTPPGRRVRAAERRTLSPIGPLINHWSDSHIPALDAGGCAGPLEAALEAAWLVMAVAVGRGDGVGR
jgi:hypothetical protein